MQLLVLHRNSCIRQCPAVTPRNTNKQTNETFQLSSISTDTSTENWENISVWILQKPDFLQPSERQNRLPAASLQLKPLPATLLNYCLYRRAIQSPGFIWSVTHKSTSEKNIQTHVARQGTKLQLYEKLLLNLTLFTQLLLTLLLFAAATKNAAKWRESIFTKRS